MTAGTLRWRQPAAFERKLVTTWRTVIRQVEAADFDLDVGAAIYDLKGNTIGRGLEQMIFSEPKAA
jgi:hypothetical protein